MPSGRLFRRQIYTQIGYYVTRLVQLLTRTNPTTTKLFLEDPENREIRQKYNCLVKRLLTSGSRTVIAQLIQEPVILTNAIHKAASISGHDAWKFVEPLVYAGDVVVQELLGDPEELVDSICRKRKVTQQSQPQRQVVGVEEGGRRRILFVGVGSCEEWVE